MSDGHDTALCGGPGVCGTCNQEAATAAFRDVAGHPDDVPCGDIVTCPSCHTKFDPLAPSAPIRVTEAADEAEAVRSTELFDETQHARAPAGAAAGGQFVAASSSSGGGSKGKGGGSPHGTLSYNARTGQGAGYGRKGGNPDVKRLQLALNRLGLTDADGKKLALDGRLGPKTTAAIKKAQKALGVKADGKVSPAFLAKLTKTRKLPQRAGGKAPAAPAKRTKARTKTVTTKNSTMTSAAVEAMVNGSMSFEDIREAVRAALQQRIIAETGKAYCWVYVSDLTTTDVVYASGDDDLYECPYEISDAGAVTLGDPHQVVRTYMPAPSSETDTDGPEGDAAVEAAEESDRIYGRVIEAKGKAADGGRVFYMRIIRYGDSRNGRRYTESVMSTAAPLYEGAAAYDHHRTLEEMRSSTISGLIGYYRNAEAMDDGVYADLHLLPGATHAAEALDATLAAQEAGLPPLVGVSHDVMGHYKPVVTGGRRLQEATAITKVNSVDLVKDPAAGGQATRMVAGGIDGPGTEPAEQEEDDVPPTKDDILGALAEATDEELAGVGLARAVEADKPGTGTEQVLEATAIASPKDGWMAKAMVAQKVKDAGLPEAVVESLTADLPDRITEADVDGRIAGLKNMFGVIERAGLTPTAGHVQVTQEARDKKVAALDSFFAGRFSEGYRSFQQAWQDWTGHRPQAWDEDVNKRIMRESAGVYDSGDRLRMEDGSLQLRESMDSTTWNLVLGDSITRRMVAEYQRPNLAVWRRIVSSIIPLTDFREQKIERVGGYGLLPVVNQGAPYQSLTSPPNEEAKYSPTKKGGTEDITYEMVANDDIRAISNVPRKLGLAAAQTLYRFIFDFFTANGATSYDAVAWFHATHANTGTSALSQTALSAVRAAMRQQAAYGDSKDILSIVPQTLIVPSALEELAWQLATSAVAIPATPAGPSDAPNIHHRMNEPIVVDYYSDANDWFAIADPAMVPTIEIGFLGGREDPELFTQSDPTVGSMFDADKSTYKIRHVYGGGPVDHRGVYRNTL